MPTLSDDLNQRLDRFARDVDSGAAALLDEAIAIVRAARTAGAPLPPVARALCRAQPSMASIWNAALEAIASDADPPRFERFAARVARSAQALGRFAVGALCSDARDRLRVVTLSSSRSVLTAIDAVRAHRAVVVSCAESRPALEGRTLAARLARAGVAVTCFSDAAIAHALAGADAVLVGADAIVSDAFVNKSGTRMLAAAAGVAGVPVYVAATRDKFAGDAVAARLTMREGARHEIWGDAPDGVEVRNPYFEAAPIDLVTAVISDMGVLGAGMVPEVCRSVEDAALRRALDEMAP